jgi:HicB family
MRKTYRIRLSSDQHKRIKEAALARGVSINAFVENAIEVALVSARSSIQRFRFSAKAGSPDFLLAGVRNGKPGYKRCGVNFATWFKKNRDPHEIREVREMLEVIDSEMLRKEKLKTFYAWFQKFFPEFLEQIPSRRWMLFAEGFMATIND